MIPIILLNFFNFNYVSQGLYLVPLLAIAAFRTSVKKFGIPFKKYNNNDSKV